MTPAELKAAGQSLSLFATTPDIWADFVAILAAAPIECSSNDTRAACDRLAIPESARGGLFNAAIKAGLIFKKVTSDDKGNVYPARIPSTSPKTHNALVQVYVKPAAWRRAS